MTRAECERERRRVKRADAAYRAAENERNRERMRKCRSEGRYTRRAKCLICGNTFRRKTHNHRTCSKECARTHAIQYCRSWHKGQIRRVIRATCVVCGSEFVARTRKQISCSKSCRKKRAVETAKLSRDRPTRLPKSCGVCHCMFLGKVTDKVCKKIECKTEQAKAAYASRMAKPENIQRERARKRQYHKKNKDHQRKLNRERLRKISDLLAVLKAGNPELLKEFGL